MCICLYLCIYWWSYFSTPEAAFFKYLFIWNFWAFSIVYMILSLRVCVCIYIYVNIQYSFQVIPKVGELVAGDAESYQYLVESIRRFPKQVLNNLLIGTHLHQPYYIITCLSHAICACKGFTYTYILRRNCLLWCPM